MRFAPGFRLGPYEVRAPIGAGGMGEVYRAHDPSLNRDVAIKVVKPDLCRHPDSRGRLHREARALAALSHPHIATIHEFGEVDDVCYFVMEFVPGESLDAMLGRGRLKGAEALFICRQVAAALEAAHDKGIIHRDLKPGNVRVTPDRVVKVLDFGLARELCAAPSPETTAGPAAVATATGVVLGTTAYMSPEQARGLAVDRRTDIWAFGCLLYECLTGHMPFRGPTAQDTLVAVLEREPDWQLLPQQTPAPIRRMLRRCLEKDMTRRLRDFGDAIIDIDEALAESGGPAGETAAAAPAHRGAPGRWIVAAGGLVAGLLIGAAAAWTLRGAPQPRASIPPARFVVPLAAGERFVDTDFPILAIAPDSTLVAYVASRGGQRQLFIRPLNGEDAVPVAGSANAVSPFFSTDSRWLAFFAEGQLKKVPVAGGTPVNITSAEVGFGGSWGADDTIVFSPAPGAPLWRVPAGGGTPLRLTRLDADRGEFSHRWPEILPEGRAVLFTVGTVGSWDDAEIVAASLDGSRREVLVKGGTHPHFLATGHLLYTHAGAGWVAPFDPDRLTLSGPPQRVLNDVLASSDGASQLSVSPAGTVVYLSATALQPPRRLMALDDRSDLAPLAAPPRQFAGPRVSPDGRKIVLTIAGAAEEIWTYDIPSGSLDSVTSASENLSPIWTPDSRRITFSSNRGGTLNLYMAPIDGSAPPERLTTSDNLQFPGSWSAGGQQLAYVEHHPQNGRDIWLLNIADRRATPFAATAADETGPAFSPDGRWIAFVSNRTGRNEVYVRSTGQPAVESPVSPEGGSEPVWARDGRELYYRSGDRLMAVASEALSRPNPRVVFQGTFEPGTPDRANYDVAGAGRRFVMLTSVAEREAPGAFHVLINWSAGGPR